MKMKHLLRHFFLGLLITVVAGCSGGGGSETATTADANSPPISPVGVVVLANNAANSLQWNSVPGATSYNIYWSTNSGTGTSGTKTSSVSSFYSHTALTNGTTYYYVITAVNSVGESAPSVEVSGIPTIPPIGAPSFGSVIPGDKQTLLSWSPVGGATSYNLYWSTSSGKSSSGTKVSNVNSPYQHVGLTNGSTYYYVLTAVSAAGESGPSAEVAATPFASPYATAQYPFDLGTTPFGSGHDEVIPDQSRSFHYALSVKPGSVYKASLNNVLDGARLEVFTRDNWDLYYLACSDYSYEYSKPRTQCVFNAPESGIVYIRIGSTTKYPENVNLKIDEIINEGSRDVPISLGGAPSTPVFGTVREAGESVYQVAVSPGKDYRTKLTDWTDGGATLSRLYLEVYDGSTITGSPLCSDFGGNAGTDHEHRLRIIHCLAKPKSNVLTIVAREVSYGKGATYDIAVEEALTEGASGAPVVIAGDALVYDGEVTASQPFNAGYSYYQLSVTPNTNYLVDLRGMHQQLDLVITDNNSFTTSSCNSRQSSLIDESCLVNSGQAGTIYALVHSWDYITDTFILSAMPVPVGAIAPARYPDEGSAGTPIAIGGLPVSNRLSTVGIGDSYYSVPVVPGTTMRVSATKMNVDVDIHIYSDATYANRLCASRNADVGDDSCEFTVPAGVGAIYIRADGQFTTNNGDWGQKTEEDVGAMFRLSVEVI